MIDHLDRDDEYYGLMLRLVVDGAEGARLDAEELRSHGFEPVQVAGLDRLLWKQDDGPLDGDLLTEESALAHVRAMRCDEEGGQP